MHNIPTYLYNKILPDGLDQVIEGLGKARALQ